MTAQRSFTYTQNPDAEEPTMYIDREIGTGIEKDSGKARIDGNEFLKELLYHTDECGKNVCVYINSPGGVVTDGMAIYHGIRNAKTKVTTYNYGIAYSIAAVLFQGGYIRIMGPQSSLMFHPPYQEGDAEMSSSDKKMLKVLNEGIITMIASNTERSREDIEKMVNRTTFLTAAEAKEQGFCDQIDNNPKLMNLQGEGKEKWLNANKILNRSDGPPIKKKMETKSICNKLQLNEEASEAAMLNAIDALILDKKNSKTKMDELQEKYDKKMKECDDIKAEMEGMKKAKKDEMDAKALAEAEENDKKAEAELVDAVNKGKIKDDADVVKKWKALFKADFKGTKDILDSMPVNKEGAKFNPNLPGHTLNKGVEGANLDEVLKGAAKQMGLKPGSGEYYNFIATQKANHKQAASR